MARKVVAKTGVIANAGSLTPAIDISDIINGTLGITTTFASSAAITFQGCSSRGGTFLDIYDSADGGVTYKEATIPAGTHAARAYELPAVVMNFPFIKIRSGVTGAAVTQSPGAAGTTLTISGKA